MNWFKIATIEENINEDAGVLDKFIIAQEKVYNKVIDELRKGRKISHWMWFIFPQIEGLGISPISKRYSMKNIGEAKNYLSHPVLGKRLRECSDEVLRFNNKNICDFFKYPDDLKLRSSMTLFSLIEGGNSIFSQVLDKYFEGEKDEKTLQILDSID